MLAKIIILVMIGCVVQICRDPQAKQIALVKQAIARAKDFPLGQSCKGVAAYDDGRMTYDNGFSVEEIPAN